ncbi:hypothetical protein Tco_0252994 [Tanacetum coccineum]
MADNEKKSTMKRFTTNDQADCYSGIISITVNGKNAYEQKFLDDLHNNAFSGTNGEDVVEHVEYFLKIVDPIDLPNVNQDTHRVVVFPISLAGDAWRWFDGINGSITSWVDLTAKCFGKSSDEDLEEPIEDQSLPADASPTALSPGYIADSNPEEDKEDPEEDLADHPVDGGDNNDNESSDDDDDDDDVEKDEEDEEKEEEHLAPADLSVVPIDDLVPLS